MPNRIVHDSREDGEQSGSGVPDAQKEAATREKCGDYDKWTRFITE
jgi:hypothetical protein